jgi:hypothetical protein
MARSRSSESSTSRLHHKTHKKSTKRQFPDEVLRPNPSLPPKKLLLISLEDEQSSRLYFKRFQDELYSKRIVLADHRGSDPKSVVLAAKERNAEQDRIAEKGLDDPFDEVWVVFDTEGPQNQPRQVAARNAIQQVRDLNAEADKPKFKTAVSNPTFEYWFLHHFEYYVKNLPNGDSVIRLLKEHKHIPDYKKGKDYFEILRQRTNDAIRSSRRVFKERCQDDPHPCNCHPCTEVHSLVESLLGEE